MGLVRRGGRRMTRGWRWIIKEHDSASGRNKNVESPIPQLADARVKMCDGGDRKGEIQSTQETEHAIPVTKRSRKDNPRAYQCGKRAR